MTKGKIKTYTIEVKCAKCKVLLYRYRKEGAGSLVKCYVSGILEDNTQGDLKCPSCKTEFARKAMYHGRPAHKIIQGKVFVVGHCGK